ncbi:T7SS effector LXG polymorphic toxin, partial [Enterococcus plantarum]
AKKHLDKIIQKVNEFDSKQQPSSAEEIINVLAQQIKMSETASGLSYTDPRFMEFVSQTGLAEAIQDIDSQIAQAEADAKLAAEKAAKEKQEQWAKRHPVENFLKNMSDSIGDWWGNVVEGTKNLSIPNDVKNRLLFVEGFIGGAGSMVSSVAISASELVHLGVELVEWGLDSARGIQTPQWKLDDIKGAWENAKAIGTTLGTVVLGVNAMLNPQIMIIDPVSREAARQTFDMGKALVDGILTDIVNGNAYEIGGYVFDVASMFIGVGEVSAALKGTKLAGKITEGLNAFKATTKATTLGKLGKATTMVDKALKYGDDAAKAFATKLKNIPMPVMDELAFAGQSMGKMTLGDYMEAFSKGDGFADDVVKKVSEAADDIKIPSVRNNEFNKWFDNLTSEQLEKLWKNTELRKKIEDRIRRPGGYHEWHLVSRTPTFKKWGVSMDDIKELRTLTKDVEFVNPSGWHGGRGSTKAHNEILKIIDNATDYDNFVVKLNEWASSRLKNGIQGLPEGLRR